MSIENQGDTVSLFRAFAKRIHFSSTSDPNTFYSDEKNDLYFLLALTKEGTNNRIDLGIRPNSSFNNLANVLSSEMPTFIPNPFREKWCVLAWFQISPTFSCISAEGVQHDVLNFVQCEVENLRTIGRNHGLSYWADLIWRSKKFDGISRYSLVYVFLELGDVETARRIVYYFTLMTAVQERQFYHRKLSRIFNHFNIGFDWPSEQDPSDN